MTLEIWVGLQNDLIVQATQIRNSARDRVKRVKWIAMDIEVLAKRSST